MTRYNYTQWTKEAVSVFVQATDKPHIDCTAMEHYYLDNYAEYVKAIEIEIRVRDERLAAEELIRAKGDDTIEMLDRIALVNNAQTLIDDMIPEEVAYV